MAIKIYTLSNFRPDFIELQYNSIKKFVSDLDIEYIVFNNAVRNRKRSMDIQNICSKLGVTCLPVKIPTQKSDDASRIVSASLEYMWQNHIRFDTDISCYIDSDMFFIRNILIREILSGYDISIVPNYRGPNFEVFYPWTGLMFFNMATLPNPEEMSWKLGSIKGHRVDVGGMNHFYFEKYAKQIKILYLEMYTLEDLDQKTTITGLNGNIRFINGNTSDFFISEKRSFPYQKEDPNYYQKLNSDFSYLHSFFNKYGPNFPHPYYMDLIKCYGQNISQSFILHYKSGSNWKSFTSPDYNQRKTIELNLLMANLGVNSTKQYQNMPTYNPVRMILHKIKAIFNKTWAISEYRKTIKIYDIFTFFNELDLLEIRLNILDPYVDYFVIVECNETFSGKPKPLYFKENESRFARFRHKIIHHVTTDAPKNMDDLKSRLKDKSIGELDAQIIEQALTSDNIPTGSIHWLKEFYQKECLRKALVGLNDDDICFVSDVDEIWNPETIVDFRKDDIFKLKQNVYVYYLNNRSNEPWAGTLVTKYKNIKNNCLNHLRTVGKTKYTYIKNGGWHFSFMGGADQVRKKLDSYGHQEFNTGEVRSSLEKRIQNNQDFIGRSFKLWKDESDLPKYLLDNKQKYKKMFSHRQ